MSLNLIRPMKFQFRLEMLSLCSGTVSLFVVFSAIFVDVEQILLASKEDKPLSSRQPIAHKIPIACGKVGDDETAKCQRRAPLSASSRGSSIDHG